MSQASSATTGSLAEKPLAHLFVYAHDKQLSGSLELTQQGAEGSATIVLSRGDVAKIRTSAPVAYLGAVLYELAIIDDAALNASLRTLAREKRPHGQILLDEKVITRAQLAEGLREQALRKLAHLFSFAPSTRFAFHAGVDALPSFGGGDVVLTDPFPAIWRGIREYPALDHVRDVLARLGGAPCRLARDARIERFHFQSDEIAAVECLRTRTISLAELGATAILPARTTELLIYCLLITKQLEMLARSPRTMPPAEAHAFATGPTMPQMGAVGPAPTVRPPVRASVREDPPGLVRTISSPAMTAVRAASPADIAEARVDPISFNLRVPSPIRGSSPPPTPRSPSGPPRKASSPSNPRIAAELAERAKAIRDRARDIQNEDHFQRLSLPRDATAGQIDQAFTALSRMWDGTTLPPALEGSRDDCAIVLSALMDAHDTLMDVRRRGEYVRKLRVGQALLPPTASEDLAASGAANEYDGAKACLAKGDLDRAERLAKRAYHARPDHGPTLALLAWIEASKPANQGNEATRQALAKLDKAVKLDHDCEETFVYRWQLHKRLENHPAAMRDLKRVTILNPNNVEAIRELRIYEMRVRNDSISMQAVRPSSPPSAKPPESSGGLFTRFLKK